MGCGRKYNGKNCAGFDMHHIGKKIFSLNITNLIKKKWKDIIEESIKCEIRCAFCHRILHFGGY